ncbi:MAG: glycosyltransferase [Bauldia sp.]|nr:MAG: glycosyltransferase [Bauldia sp.]
MKQTVSIIMPAFRAAPFIAAAVRSVLAQSFADWLLFIIADDGFDYAALLASEGLADPRLRFLSSGAVGGGASRARNLALDVIDTPYAAILDADDRFKPAKLARAATPSHSISVPAYPVDPVDTVGAGDTFCGYFAAGLDAGLDLEPAMRRAAVAASLACLTPGAQPAIPHAGQVDAAL